MLNHIFTFLYLITMCLTTLHYVENITLKLFSLIWLFINSMMFIKNVKEFGFTIEFYILFKFFIAFNFVFLTMSHQTVNDKVLTLNFIFTLILIQTILMDMLRKNNN